MARVARLAASVRPGEGAELVSLVAAAAKKRCLDGKVAVPVSSERHLCLAKALSMVSGVSSETLQHAMVAHDAPLGEHNAMPGREQFSILCDIMDCTVRVWFRADFAGGSRYDVVSEHFGEGPAEPIDLLYDVQKEHYTPLVPLSAHPDDPAWMAAWRANVARMQANEDASLAVALRLAASGTAECGAAATEAARTERRALVAEQTEHEATGRVTELLKEWASTRAAGEQERHRTLERQRVRQSRDDMYVVPPHTSS